MSKKNKKFHVVATTALALTLTLPALSTSAASVQNGSKLTPIRDVAAKIGAEIKWNQSTQSVTLTNNNHVITFKIGEKRH